MVRRVLGLLFVGAVLWWPATAFAQARQPANPRDQVVLAGDVVVAKGTVVGEVVVFSGTATVSGVVLGDVVVLHGPALVAGQVSGDVIVLDGAVRVLKTAQVSGDVRGGRTVTVQPGAQVGGSVQRDVAFTLAGPLGALGALVAPLAMAASVLLVLVLVLLLTPRAGDRIADAARTAPLASAAWGLGFAALVPVAAVALVVSVLGLPLGLAVLLASGLLWLFGIASATWALGRLVVREPGSRLGAVGAGWGIGVVIGLVPVLNAVWWALAGIVGLGATIVAVWRTRAHARPRADERTRGRHRARRGRPPEERPSAALPETPLGED
ncbi:MAG: polymer-forming cytoskeletal protein [Actinomycetota bacterium]